MNVKKKKLGTSKDEHYEGSTIANQHNNFLPTAGRDLILSEHIFNEFNLLIYNLPAE